MAKVLTPKRLAQRKKNLRKIGSIFNQLSGKMIDGFPVIDTPVFHTKKKDTPYLKRPGVAMLAKPAVNVAVMQGFLGGFDEQLNFQNYTKDPAVLEPGAQLAKIAGQACYMSFGPTRTPNSEAAAYLEDVKESGHGSVIEHPTYTFLVYGISRSLTHELVRHRQGVAFSQESQRYVGGKVLRFIERPEFQNDPKLHKEFEEDIDWFAKKYEEKTDELCELQSRKQDRILSGDTKTELRKKVRQAARSELPNCTEAVIVWSVNGRAFQHIETMRGSEFAETEIRELAFRAFLCMAMIEPTLFGDFEIVDYPDGTHGVSSPYKKP